MLNRFQIFADEATNEAPEESTKDAPKYTDEDVDRLISEKFAKWEKRRQEEEAKKIQEAKEAEKLKNMSETEKTNARLADMEKQLESYKAKEAHSAMEKEARRLFQDADLSVNDSLVSMVVSDKAETTKANVDSVIALIRAEVKKATQAMVDKATPKTGKKSNVTKEQILAIADTNERQKLMRENWSLFQKGN